MAIQFIEQHDGIRFAVKVVPGSSRDRIVGEYAGGLKITVRKAPERGAANEAVIALLAAALKTPASNIRITRGQTNPRKEVFIQGIGRTLIRQRLGDLSGSLRDDG